MNGQDRTEIKELANRVAGVETGLSNVSQAVEAIVGRDGKLSQVEQKLKVIVEYSLPNIKERAELNTKIIGIGLGSIALVITIFGILITVAL